MAPSSRRIAVPAGVLAGLVGVLCGLLTFAASGALWRAGDHTGAALLGKVVLLAGLASIAAVTSLAQPARMLRARVPINRAVPHAWWPGVDPLPVLAVCVGGPLLAGAGAASLLFR